MLNEVCVYVDASLMMMGLWLVTASIATVAC